MGKRKILFVINPKSGVSSKRSVPVLIEKYLDRERFDYTIAPTQYMAHACELTKDAVAKGFDAVIAVGGDGTVNEVARVLVGTDTALGVLPCGSGNGFSRHLGVPMNIKKAIEFINSSEPTPIDYGKINGIPFFCTCGMGFDATVSKSFAEGSHRGYIGYITNTIRQYFSYKPDIYEIESDTDTIKRHAFVLACGNASQYGNDYYITPHASVKDGLLSMTVLKPFSILAIPRILVQVISGRLGNNKHVETFSSKSIKIRRSTPGAVHFDGEPADMGTEITIVAVADGLKVLAAPNWNGKAIF